MAKVLIVAQDQTAAIRSQANTAKLLVENPTLMRLRELEVLEKIAWAGHLKVVLGEKGLIDKQRLLPRLGWAAMFQLFNHKGLPRLRVFGQDNLIVATRGHRTMSPKTGCQSHSLFRCHSIYR
jgi:hypothetical protein